MESIKVFMFHYIGLLHEAVLLQIEMARVSCIAVTVHWSFNICVIYTFSNTGLAILIIIISSTFNIHRLPNITFLVVS